MPAPVAALSDASDDLIASIRAIEADKSLIEEEKARWRQALVSGGAAQAVDKEEKGKKKKAKGEDDDVLDLFNEKFKCAFCMQLPEKPVTDIEFTVQKNRLWMLQCRIGKRTGKGAIKIAVDIVKEGLVDTRSAIKMVEPGNLDQLLHPQFEDPSTYKDKVIATGLPASPSVVVGQVVFTADDAEAWHA
ncbi:hypothetical protein COCNU_scaffold002849G000030 [Cocos nucifera]|nr:hypothetical protein [Cocos nucifera]